MLDQKFGELDSIRYKGAAGVVLEVIEDSGEYFYNIRLYDPVNEEFAYVKEVPQHQLSELKSTLAFQ